MENISMNLNNAKNSDLLKEINAQFTISNKRLYPKIILNNFKHIKFILLIKKLNEKKNNNLKEIKKDELMFNEQKLKEYKDYIINQNINCSEEYEIQINNLMKNYQINDIEKKILELKNKLKESKNKKIIIDKINSLLRLKLIIFIKILEKENINNEISNNLIQKTSEKILDDDRKHIENQKNEQETFFQLLEYFSTIEIDPLYNENKCLTFIGDNEYLKERTIETIFLGKKRTKSLEIKISN